MQETTALRIQRTRGEKEKTHKVRGRGERTRATAGRPNNKRPKEQKPQEELAIAFNAGEQGLPRIA